MKDTRGNVKSDAQTQQETMSDNEMKTARRATLTAVPTEAVPSQDDADADDEAEELDEESEVEGEDVAEDGDEDASDEDDDDSEEDEDDEEESSDAVPSKP